MTERIGRRPAAPKAEDTGETPKEAPTSGKRPRRSAKAKAPGAAQLAIEVAPALPDPKLAKALSAAIAPAGGFTPPITGPDVLKGATAPGTDPLTHKILSALGPGPLNSKIRKLSDADVASAVKAIEAAHPMPAPAAIAARLSKLVVGKTVELPLNLIHPGQVQISFRNVREKMEDFVTRVDERREDYQAHPKKSKTDLLDYPEALTAVIGPGARSLILTDGHHHIAALKATQHVVNKIVGAGVPHAAPGSKVGGEIAFVNQLFGGKEGVPNVPIRVVGDLRDVPESQLWGKLAALSHGHRWAYLVDRQGSTQAAAPTYFGQLENNPYRYLASVLTGKIEMVKDDLDWKLNLHGGDPPVWLKVIGQSPDFIEFPIARVLERAYAETGRTYDQDKAPSETDRLVARYALFRAQLDPADPEHEALAGLIVTTKDRSLHKLEKRLDVDAGDLDLPKKIYRPSKRRLRRLEDTYVELVMKAQQKG